MNGSSSETNLLSLDQQSTSSGLHTAFNGGQNTEENDQNSVMTGNEDNMDVGGDEENETGETSSDEEEEEGFQFHDYPIISQLQGEEQNILKLLDYGMSFIENLTKATKENINTERSKEELKKTITGYYDTLFNLKNNLARHIHLASLYSSLNYEGSTYSERKKIEIENRKAKILKNSSIDQTKAHSDIFNDDMSLSTLQNLDNISQSNISIQRQDN
ncbi:hypothetical protein FDP41_010806 [Naegleria fowleri]|uniref:Mediator of RNA polymerase II transcription subunit 11 n=1 Tax=Naegleria fowleri TaxID=5763 RepID=A0A6A5C024_NAEFO|nr:uncharacterized protein FDP41_010806 [Naegleria fowleri]KAF0982827.1 hypothetical protein FDP41_010806 [Naegleria fowleri]CAG4707750.1 unnamed protein product [Naegleria fowleri]